MVNRRLTLSASHISRRCTGAGAFRMSLKGNIFNVFITCLSSEDVISQQKVLSLTGDETHNWRCLEIEEFEMFHKIRGSAKYTQTFSTCRDYNTKEVLVKGGKSQQQQE